METLAKQEEESRKLAEIARTNQLNPQTSELEDSDDAYTINEEDANDLRRAPEAHYQNKRNG